MMAGRYTLLDRQAETDLLPVALENGTEIVVAGVFNSGILAAGPDATNATYDYGKPSHQILARAQRINDICNAHNVPLQAAAIQFPLRNLQVSAAVLGMSRPERIAQNLAWSKIRIPEAFWAAVDGGDMI
jgi:D-threo-aldose 1-dehydrogenase